MNSLPRRFRTATFLTFALLAFAALTAGETLNLAGNWHFQLDRNNTGTTERWFSRELTGTFALPGTLPGRGIGDPITAATKWTGGILDKSWFTAPEYALYRQPGNIKVPFWLQPETYYVGAAWFQRDIEIPAGWVGRHLTLTLERPHWKTTVWLDDQELGSNDALSGAHEYEFGPVVAPGRHRLTIRVDNTHQPDIGENSHSISDHTQGNWNGLVGRIELTATAPVWIDALQVSPRIKDRTAIVNGHVRSQGNHPLPATVRLSSNANGPVQNVAVAANGTFTASYALGADAALWDEFSPALHRITATLDNGTRREAVFGLREIAAEGRQLLINGRKLFLRGTLDCAAFPRTGHPPTDIAEWKRILGVARAYGLNHIRFHSWCPPEAAFTAADELGVYLQVEVASWPNWSTTLGDGKPVDAWIDAETARIVRAYGNHPSFIILCAGNEPGGDHHSAWLSAWVTRQKSADPHRLYTAGAGWPEVPENDFHLRSEPRIQQWGQGLTSRINHLPPETRTDYQDFINARTLPVVSHEIGQWCVYPNFAEMAKYTGYLKPRNFEIFQASLKAHGLLDQAQDFLIASGKLQALCYKEDIESALRTPEMGGFQLLGLNDFPGQGTALVGVVDPFWEDKGYITAPEFRRFCASTVPLARIEKRVFTTDEHFTADLEVAHFGATPLAKATATWKLVGEDGAIAASGNFPSRDIALGNSSLGHLDLALNTFAAPARYKLVVTLAGTPFENDWDVWVYPPAAQVAAPAPSSVIVTSKLDAATQAKLVAGGTVLLTIPPGKVKPDAAKGKIALGFSSIFWNTAWTNGQAPHTLGILCDPKHPAFANFPTDPHSNWQWWYPVTHASTMILDGLPTELHPIVQVIDDWVTNRKLALVFEAKVGNGRLLVTSISLDDPVLDPVRRQLRASLLNYMVGPSFRPTVTMSADQVRSLISE